MPGPPSGPNLRRLVDETDLEAIEPYARRPRRARYRTEAVAGLNRASWSATKSRQSVLGMRSAAVGSCRPRTYASNLVTASKYVNTVFGLLFSAKSDRRKLSARAARVGPEAARGLRRHFGLSKNLSS
jgi:hypothetical protein